MILIGILQVHEVAVDEPLRRGTDPGRDDRRRCDEMAFKYLADHCRIEAELRLVHGTLHIVGRPYPHAWVEVRGEIVFDPSSQLFYDRAGDDQMGQAEATRVYTAKEAGEMALQTNHDGPWHETTSPASSVGDGGTP